VCLLEHEETDYLELGVRFSDHVEEPTRRN